MSSRFSAAGLSRQPRLVWWFWVAAALALVGGVAPFVLGGGSSRLAGVIVQFGIAAGALALCGVLHDRGRTVTGVLYFIGGVALILGTLTLFAFQVELAMLGTCAAAPAPCVGGLQRPLTTAETSGIGVASAFAFAALITGFVGLAIVFRRHAVIAPAPPLRKIPAVTSTRSEEPVRAATAAPTNGAGPAAEEPELELPAHQEENRPELPPHESNPPTA